MKDIFNEEQIKKMQEIIDDYLFTKKICITLLDDELDAPKYAHETDAAFDLQSREKLVIKPGEKAMIATGIKIRIPDGYEIQIRPRSGISSKTYLRISNTPGTIDSGYLGEIKVLFTNIGTEEYTINKKDKIAQAVLARYTKAEINIISNDEFENFNSDRGSKGFGSTGMLKDM